MISIVMLLKSLHRCIGRRVERVSKNYDVTGVQFFVLKFLQDNENKDIYQKDLEKFMNIRGSTATGILKKLTQKGYIERKSLPNDARLKKIVLCEKSKGMIEEFEKEMKAINDNVENNLSTQEKETFLEVIEKIKTNLDLDENQNIIEGSEL